LWEKDETLNIYKAVSGRWIYCFICERTTTRANQVCAYEMLALKFMAELIFPFVLGVFLFWTLGVNCERDYGCCLFFFIFDVIQCFAIMEKFARDKRNGFGVKI